MTVSVNDLFVEEKGNFLIKFNVLEQLTSKEFCDYVIDTLEDLRKNENGGVYMHARINLGRRIETDLIVVLPADTVIFKHHIESNTFSKMVLDTFSRETFMLAHNECNL